MDDPMIRSRLLSVTKLASDFCILLENARNYDKADFVAEALGLLPRIYYEFSDFAPDPADPEMDFGYYPSYVDEDFYESIRLKCESVLGADDTYLETFEEDMKYSDTPIAASISESLADIFQPLYNFLTIVKESDGLQSAGAYLDCRDNFVAYWAQTLCNVMRPLNHIRYNSTDDTNL